MPLVIHFLNVGHGDCTVVEFPSGRLSMIDINNSGKLPEEDEKGILKSLGYSDLDITLRKWRPETLRDLERYSRLLVDPGDFLKMRYPGQAIFRFILTHPDMDHMSGLFRLRSQEKIPITNFWDINHAKEMSKEDFEISPYEYGDWLQYRLLRLGGDEAKVLKLQRGAQAAYYEEDGIHILSPTPELENEAQRTDNYNIASYVLLIKYGQCKIILGGDAEEATWRDIYCNIPDAFLKADVLKASHHGRKTGYHQATVKAIAPKYTIVSVGKKPDTDASYLYAQYSKVLSTRYHGTITAQCWYDGDVWLYDCNGKRVDNS